MFTSMIGRYLDDNMLKGSRVGITAAFLLLACASSAQTQATRIDVRVCTWDKDGNFYCYTSSVPPKGCKPDPVTKGCVILADHHVTTQQRKHWYSSKRFWVTFSADVAASVADYEASQQAFSRGATEDNPIFGSPRPSMARMLSIGVPWAFGMQYLGYRIGNKFKPLGYAPLVGDLAIHIPNAIHNASECRPTCNAAPITVTLGTPRRSTADRVVTIAAPVQRNSPPRD
jgi:hypothetical protein